MSKHFEGPLQVGYEFDETGYPLFVVGGLAGDQKRDRPKLEATAKLFAAAPELLAVLQKALRDSGCDGDLCMHLWHEQARSVIAKAAE